MVFLRDVLATVDKPLTIVLEPLGEGKIHVRTSSWHQAVVISADEVLEAVGVGKSLRLIRAPPPLGHLEVKPSGFADAGYDF